MKTYSLLLASTLLLVPACGKRQKRTEPVHMEAVSPLESIDMGKESVDVKEIGLDENVTLLGIEDESPMVETVATEETTLVLEDEEPVMYESPATEVVVESPEVIEIESIETSETPA